MADQLTRDIRRLARTLNAIRSNDLTRAEYAALNKTANAAKSAAIKGIAGDVKVPQKHIRKRLYSRVRVSDKRVARITGYRQDIPAISLGNVQTQVRKLRGQRLVSRSSRDRRGRYARREHAGNTSIRVGRHVYQNAFINKVNGKWHILRRTGEGRYPIELLAVKIRESVDLHVPDRARDAMAGQYPRLLKHELTWRLRRHART